MKRGKVGRGPALALPRPAGHGTISAPCVPSAPGIFGGKGYRVLGISWSLGDWIPVLRRLPPEAGNAVALTIDDAPMPDTTPALLDLLDQFEAKATFFLSGCRLEAEMGLAADMVARGHAIYAHGWDHIRLDRAGPARLVEDMTRCEELLASLRPTPSPYLVRLPQNGGYRNALVHRTLQEWQPGCQFAHWGASTEDHLISTRCAKPEDVAEQCQREVRRLLAQPNLAGAIVLMHDQPINERPGHAFKPQVTVTLMAQLLTALQRRGLTSVALSPAGGQSWWSRFVLV